MVVDRGHVLSALIGGLIAVVVMAALPVGAANGGAMVLGERNNALRATKLISRGGLHLIVGQGGGPALTLEVAAGVPPMVVDSDGLVQNLNADLFDGLETLALVCPGCAMQNYEFTGNVRPGSDLSGANLQSASFYFANMAGSNFSGATLHSTQFTRADLSGADLTNAICGTGGAGFQYADLSGADLDGFDCPMNSVMVVFSDGTLTGASFVGADVTKGHFARADCVDVDFTNADLTDVRFDDADLTGATLTGATLTGITWSNTTCPDGTNSDDNAGTCEGHL